MQILLYNLNQKKPKKHIADFYIDILQISFII